MNASSLAAKRFLIGLLALVCLAIVAGLWVFSTDPEHSALLAGVTRIGVVLGALWMALPASGEFPRLSRLSPMLVVGAVLFAIFAQRLRWYVIPLSVAVAIAYAFLKPRVKR